MRPVGGLKHILPVKIALIVCLYFISVERRCAKPRSEFFFPWSAGALQATPKFSFLRSDFYHLSLSRAHALLRVLNKDTVAQFNMCCGVQYRCAHELEARVTCPSANAPVAYIMSRCIKEHSRLQPACHSTVCCAGYSIASLARQKHFRGLAQNAGWQSITPAAESTLPSCSLEAICHDGWANRGPKNCKVPKIRFAPATCSTASPAIALSLDSFLSNHFASMEHRAL
jgi:hypothetical protein